ncbi:TadA family conjugal transfer-associated ATPase [Aeromicrobium phragmitis]|uniref:TadA family conjugal transfer-associated ATPase n=1 Tax=Aeromicrobium phragmitis TaxID=2478914 RepID=A0A3L8PQP1_9ACTN|nr:TadA family conjugal transfer-associated ATPase [Aeromicrobium phragmitis]RLV57514.1 TadA family conjugal transfer-associated ATPase [Aeromicrobium phragmitis]
MDSVLVDQVRRRLTERGDEPTPATVAAALQAEHRLLGTHHVLAIVDRLRDETHGAGVLAPLLQIPGVTDVLVNGASDVFIDRGRGVERRPVAFADEADVRRLAQRLAAHAGRRLDDASPWVDARLPDGTRVHAVLSPLARPGTTISLRVPARRRFSLADLEAAGSVSGPFADTLRELIAARVAFLVTGGTGSGKTTVLAALLGEVPPDERVVLVEDASELRPDHPHVVGLEARPANVEGAGLVTVRDLVRQALRMRPDRLVVGEVRGAEVVDLLAALNTGHEGGCGTVHANSPAALPARLEALGVAAGLSRAAVHSQMAAGVKVVVHVARDPRRAGQRVVQQVAVLQSDGDGWVRVTPALTRSTDGDDVEGAGIADLRQTVDAAT